MFVSIQGTKLLTSGDNKSCRKKKISVIFLSIYFCVLDHLLNGIHRLTISPTCLPSQARLAMTTMVTATFFKNAEKSIRAGHLQL